MKYASHPYIMYLTFFAIAIAICYPGFHGNEIPILFIRFWGFIFIPGSVLKCYLASNPYFIIIWYSKLMYLPFSKLPTDKCFFYFLYMSSYFFYSYNTSHNIVIILKFNFNEKSKFEVDWNYQENTRSESKWNNKPWTFEEVITRPSVSNT